MWLVTVTNMSSLQWEQALKSVFATQETLCTISIYCTLLLPSSREVRRMGSRRSEKKEYIIRSYLIENAKWNRWKKGILLEITLFVACFLENQNGESQSMLDRCVIACFFLNKNCKSLVTVLSLHCVQRCQYMRSHQWTALCGRAWNCRRLRNNTRTVCDPLSEAMQ